MTSRPLVSVLLIVALVVAACGDAPEFDGWCYTFVFNGLDRTPESLIVTEGTVTEVGIDSVEIAENQWSIIFEFEVLPFVQVDDIRFQIFNWTDPLVTVGAAATGTVFGQSANLEGDLDLDDNQIWIPGNVLDDYMAGRTVEVTIQADGPISLYQLQVGGDDDVSPFGADDCSPATATPEPTITQTPEITNTPEPTTTPSPSPSWTPGGPTPTPSYEYCTIVVLDGASSAVASFNGIPWDGRPESPWPGIRWWHKNVNSVQAGNSIWPFLPWEEGTPYKIQGFEVFVGRDSYQPSATQGMQLRFMDGGTAVHTHAVPVYSTSYITGLGTNNGYNIIESGSLAGEADLELVGTNLDTFQFYTQYYGIGGSWGSSNKYGFFSDLSLEVCGPPVGDPTPTPTNTPTITNTPTPTPTRTPIAGTFVYTPSPGTPAPTPWPWTTATVTPWATNTPIPVAPSPTTGPSPTPLPTSTFIATSTQLPVPTFETTGTAIPTWVIGEGSPIPQITAIFTGQPLPDVTLQATNLGTIPTVSHRSEVYWFLATADAQVAQLPSSIGAYIPDLSGGGAELFGYTKWMISGVSIQEIFGPTFAPHGFHAVVAFTIVIVGSLIMLGLRIVKLMLKIALWLINQVLKLIPGLG